MRLIELKAENFKRLVAVQIAPSDPVTPITGRNGAGKTSVLDAITAALGGGSQAPELPIRAGQSRAVVVLDLGDLTVTRKWTAKGSTLEVATKDGAAYKSPQAVLDKLVGELSFDPLTFTRMKPGEQADTLARVAGLDLAAHRTTRATLFADRTIANKTAKELRAQAAGMPPPDAGTPDVEVSVAEIFAELKAAEEAGRNYAKVEEYVRECAAKVEAADRRVENMRQLLAEAERDANTAAEAALAARSRLAQTPAPPDPEPIRARGRDCEQVNRRVRAKRDRAAKERSAADLEATAKDITAKLDRLDADLATRLAAAALPVPGLSIAEGGVVVGGIPFGQCSGAEKLRVSVAIGLALNPKLKLMLIRDGSLLDDEGMRLLAELAEAADAQVLIERVSNGDGVGVRIVDGHTEDQTPAAA